MLTRLDFKEGGRVGLVPLDVLSYSEPILAIASSARHQVLLDANRRVFAWGNGKSGQLGNGERKTENNPVLVEGLTDIKEVHASGAQTAAITTAGCLYVWGWSGNREVLRPLLIRKSVQSVAVGDFHALCLVKGESVDGSLIAYSWGSNSKGELGFVSFGERTDRPTRIETLANKQITKIYAGNQSSFAITQTGFLYCWGSCELGSLGLAIPSGCIATTRKNPFISNIVDIAIGRLFVLALTRGGKVYSWGQNQAGQLGLGDLRSRSSPTLIPKLCNIVNIQCVKNTAFAISAYYLMYTWGKGQVDPKQYIPMVEDQPIRANCSINTIFSWNTTMYAFVQSIEKEDSLFHFMVEDVKKKAIVLSTDEERTGDLYRQLADLGFESNSFILVRKDISNDTKKLISATDLCSVLKEELRKGPRTLLLLPNALDDTIDFANNLLSLDDRYEKEKNHYNRVIKGERTSTGIASKPRMNQEEEETFMKTILQSGYVKKLRKGKQWKRRYIIMTPFGWAYYKTQLDIEPLRIIEFNGNLTVSIEYSKKGEARLAFLCPAGHFLFQFENSEVMKKWHHSVRHCLQISRKPLQSKPLYTYKVRQQTFLLWLNFILAPKQLSISTVGDFFCFPVLEAFKNILSEQEAFRMKKPSSKEEVLAFYEEWNHIKSSLSEEDTPTIQELGIYLWFRQFGIFCLTIDFIVLLHASDLRSQMTFLWKLILLYYSFTSKILGSTTQEQSKKAVLDFCSSCYSSYFGSQLQFEQFDCFQDGLVLCSMVHYFLPNRVPLFEAPSTSNEPITLTSMLDLIYFRLGMVPLISIHNFESSIDEFAIMLFVLEFERKMKEWKGKAQ